jgi:hypothetical protein
MNHKTRHITDGFSDTYKALNKYGDFVARIELSRSSVSLNCL